MKPYSVQPGAQGAESQPQSSVTRSQAADDLGKLIPSEDEPVGTDASTTEGEQGAAADKANGAETTQQETTEESSEAAPEANPEKSEAKADAEQEETGEKQDDDAADVRVNERVQRRIDELTARRKEAEAKASEAQAKIEAAEARAKQLEATAAAELGLHPAYVAPSEAALIREANSLEERRSWLVRHFDGHEDDSDPARSLSAAQVREEFLAVDRKASQITAKAQALYDERKRLMLEDMETGRKIREAKAKAPAVKTTATAPAKAAAPATKTISKPTAAAPSASPAGRVTQPTSRRGFDPDRFNRNGGDITAASKELAQLIPA